MTTATAESGMSTILLVILALILPPLAVGLKDGFGGSFILNIILTILAWLPGVIHALIVVLR